MLYGLTNVTAEKNRSSNVSAGSSALTPAGGFYGRFKLLCALFAAILAITFSIFSGTAIAVQVDEYERPSLSGGLAFEFQQYETQANNSSDRKQTFLQTYYLDLKGKVINRRLLTYNARIDYSLRNENYSNNKTNTDTRQYYLTTTLLPKSAIPLEAHVRRQLISLSATNGMTTTSTNYGFNWFGRFRTLPETRLYYENTKLNDSIATTTSTRAGAELKKDIGPTKNDISYSRATQNSDRMNSNNTSTNITASNYTSLGKHTNVSAYGNMSDTTTNTANFSKIQGASMNLTSAPSEEFTQAHSYIFTNYNQTDSKQTLQAYSGKIDYNYSKILHANAHINANNSTGSDQFSSNTSTAVNSGADITYSLGRRFSLGQSVLYNKTSTTIGNNAVGAVNAYSFSENTHIGFAERISLVSFSASYGLGYTEEQADYSALVRGLTQVAGAGINSSIPNAVKVSLSSSYQYSTNLQKNGPNQSIITSRASATNIRWHDTVGMTASYTRSTTKSWIANLDGNSETSSFSANVKTIPNTTLSGSASFSRYYSAMIGSSRYNSENISIGHNRNFLGGQLGAKFSFLTADSFTDTSSTKILNYTYAANYAKELMLNLKWTFSANRSENIQSQTTTINTNIINMLTYPLRSWNISAEHNYSVSEINRTSSITITQIFLRLSRDFGIYL